MTQFTLVSLLLVSMVAMAGVQTRAAGQSATLRQLMEGEQLFRSYCAACHGEDGKGRGPAAVALKAAPPDLTSITNRNRGAFPRERLAKYIAEGDPSIAAHGSKEMPIWGPNFAALAPGSYTPINERIDAIVAYLRSIQKEK